MKMHDVSPGPLTACQISGSTNLNLVIDLGHQPPCAALLDADALVRPEVTYPLRLYHCPESGLAQLDYAVAGDELYPAGYPYRAGISQPVVEAQAELAAELLALFPDIKDGLVVDVGSNDGVLLKAFSNLGVPVQGVEPTDVGDIAVANGVPTIKGFFGPEVARQIVEERGRATMVTMTHVFAHMATLGTVMDGVKELLSVPDGVLVIENHYLLALQEKNQFDSIYHEHLRTYSLKSLCVLMRQYGMEVFDAERADRYGGNIRAFAAPAGVRAVTQRVLDLLQMEDAKGLHSMEGWMAFRSRVNQQRDYFMEYLTRLHRGGHSVGGYSAPGRATPLINYYGITPELVPYIGELHDSLKLGYWTPGRHIPIVSNRRLFDEQPDYAVIFAWHYADFIEKRLRAEGLKSKLIVPLPEFRVLG